MAFFPAGLRHRPAALLLHISVTRFVARFVASLAFLPVAGLAYRFHDCFLDGLVACVPPFFQDFVVHQLVTGPALLLTRREAALGVATGLVGAGVLGGTAVACGRILDSPEQADQHSQQRRSQAHPHDFASSSASVRGQGTTHNRPTLWIVNLGSGFLCSSDPPLDGICGGGPSQANRWDQFPRNALLAGPVLQVGVMPRLAPKRLSPSKPLYRLNFRALITTRLIYEACAASLNARGN